MDLQAAVLRTSLVERDARDAVLATEILDLHAGLGPLENGDNLFFGESCLFMD
jgi:hypothetical protein